MMSSPLKCFLWLPIVLSTNPIRLISRPLLFTLILSFSWMLALDGCSSTFIITERIFLASSPANFFPFFRFHVRYHFLQTFFYEPQDCTAYSYIHFQKLLYILINQNSNWQLCFMSFSWYYIFPKFIHQQLIECLKPSTHNITQLSNDYCVGYTVKLICNWVFINSFTVLK